MVRVQTYKPELIDMTKLINATEKDFRKAERTEKQN